MSRSIAYAVAAVAAIALVGYWLAEQGDRAARERTVERYAAALQSGAAETAWRLAADDLRGAVEEAVSSEREGPDAFERFLELAAESYERQRRTGWLEFSDDGYAIVRSLGLGRGSYYRFVEHSVTGDTAYVRMHVVLNYGLMDRPDTAVTGTVFYRLGRPLGSIYPIFHGVEMAGTQTELFKLDLVWELDYAAHRDDGPTWRVRAVRPDESSAEYIDVVGPEAFVPEPR